MWIPGQGKLCQIMELNIFYQNYVYLLRFYLNVPKKSLILTYANTKCKKSYLKYNALRIIGIVDDYTVNIKESAMKIWMLAVLVRIAFNYIPVFYYFETLH